MDTQPDSELLTRKVWQVLIARATNRQTIQYRQLAVAIGVGHMLRPTLGVHLNRISLHCIEYSMLPLWVIVVRKQTGRPGKGGWPDDIADPEKAAKRIDAARERVFAEGHKWFAATPYG